MPAKITSHLRYERDDTNVRLQADLPNTELRELVLGLWCRLSLEDQRWLTQRLHEQAISGAVTLPALAGIIYEELGTPQVLPALGTQGEAVHA